MATRSIIIESNRQIAYKEARDSQQNANSANIQGGNQYPNSNWTTHIPDGLSMNVGGTVNLEAAMINTRGAGDEVLEFTGDSGIEYAGQTLYDNAAELTLAFYISNNFQFNFNLPKSRTTVMYRIDRNDYGGPSFIDQTVADYPSNGAGSWSSWESAYPYQATEGFTTDVKVTPRVYTAIPAANLPSYMKPPPRLAAPSPDKLYIGPRDYLGPYYMPIDPPETTQNPFARSTQVFQWDYYSTKQTLSIPEGFNTPAAISERLTAQLHERSGDARGWEVDNVIPGNSNMDTNGNISTSNLPAITDVTYKTFPTSQGKVIYARTNSYWDAALLGEKSSGTAVAVGTNYKPQQGRVLFYNYMMTAKPDFMNLVNVNVLLQEKPFNSADTFTSTSPVINVDKFSIFTGPGSNYTQTDPPGTTVYNIGQLGNNMVLMNEMGTKTLNCETVAVLPTNAYIPTGARGNTLVLDINKNEAIVTNVVFNSRTIQFFNDAFDKWGDQLTVSTKSSNVNDPEFRDACSVEWNFGRIDDQESNEDGRIIYLPPPISFNLGGGAYDYLPSNYLDGGVASATASYGVQALRQQGSTGITKNRRYGTPFISQNIYIKKYLPVEASANNIINGTYTVPNLYPTQSDAKFKLTPNFLGLDYLRDIWAFLDGEGPSSPGNFPNGATICLIPVWFKDLATATAYGAVNMFNADIPLMATIINIAINPLANTAANQNIPAPAVGDFCGFDPSLFNTQCSIISTTQKKNMAFEYPQSGTESTTNILQYNSAVFAGATDAAINFDGNYSRMTISDFHTATKAGNGPFQNPKEPPDNTPEQDVIRSLANNAFMCPVDKTGTPRVYTDVFAFSSGLPVISAQSGVSIIGMDIPINVGGNAIDAIESLEITYLNSNFYTNTLFSKLGFDYEQLLPRFGLVQNEFNRSNYNRYLGYGENVNAGFVQSNMVKPFTTNAYISGAEQISFSQMTAVVKSGTNTTFEIVPAGNLGTQDFAEASTNAESDILVAAQLPRKLDFPYLVVYTDIVQNPTYYGGPNGHEKLSAIAYITRNYTEGDFFFSFATNWDYVVDKDYVITSITTDIRLPDGSPAPIDENSSVIYKIVKPKAMPIPPQITAPKKKSSDDKPEARGMAKNSYSDS